MLKKIAIMELYCGVSGKRGFYNSQEVGLAKAFARLGYEALVIFPDRERKERLMEKLEEHVEIAYVPAMTIGVHSFYDLNILLEYDIELVHLDADNQIYAPSVMRFCKKHHILLYNYLGTVFSNSARGIKRILLNIAAKRNILYFRKYTTIAKTPYVRDILLRKGVSNVEVVPVGLDMEIIPKIELSKDEVRQRLRLPRGGKLLLFVGRLDKYKQPLDAVELLRLLEEDWHLIVIGRGAMKNEIISRISDYHLSSRFHHIEQIPNIQIHFYYRAADCLVNFNEREIFGMSILEAMYQGCPVIARHAPGPDWIVKDGVTGHLCDSLAEMREKLDELPPSMGEAARLRVIENFDWLQSAQKFRDIIVKSA